MPFPRKFLNEDEDILLDLHPHLWFFVAPVATLILVVGGTVAVGVITDEQPTIAVWGQLALLLLAVLWLIVRYLKWVTTSFVVTTDRLITRTGVLSKQGREIPLERVNDIACSQSIFERLIGAGDLLIESGGERGQQTISDVARPFQVQNDIYTAIESAQDRDVRRAAGQPMLSVPEQIEKLDDLRQRGVISQAEFDAKKTQLLERM